MAFNGTSPLRDFMSLRDAMDRFFEDRWVSPGSWLTWSTMGTQYLPLDVYETPDHFVLRAMTPGARPEDIGVEYQQGTLTLRVKTHAPTLDEGANWVVREISSGQAIRQVTLPRSIDIDAVQSTFENGILTLTLPKTPDARPKQIKIGTAPQIGAGADSGAA
ncbi:MAG TPA: Hsp20/alpha crystallin family protein [Candidatus Limnocylindrales bacterium]|nr:Hsp20/alpha crystallin family protein [Candidatus Limnocylindrales bacterium]